MTMLGPWLWALVVLLALTLAAFAWRWRSKPAVPALSTTRTFRADEWTLLIMHPMSKTQLRVLMHLREAVPDCLLMPQIALSKFLQVGHNRSYHQWFSAVGRRSVDFLVCSKHGDVLGVVLLVHEGQAMSSGVRRKRSTLEHAKIPVWEMNPKQLPSLDAIRMMVLTEVQAAEKHAQDMSQFHADSRWKATELQSRLDTGAAPMKGVEALELQDDRWNQMWPTDEAGNSEFLDSDRAGLPPLKSS